MTFLNSPWPSSCLFEFQLEILFLSEIKTISVCNFNDFLFLSWFFLIYAKFPSFLRHLAGSWSDVTASAGTAHLFWQNSRLFSGSIFKYLFAFVYWWLSFWIICGRTTLYAILTACLSVCLLFLSKISI